MWLPMMLQHRNRLHTRPPAVGRMQALASMLASMYTLSSQPWFANTETQPEEPRQLSNQSLDRTRAPFTPAFGRHLLLGTCT